MKASEREVKICGHGSGRPTIKNLYTYTAQRYASKAPNGVHKGIVEVRRHVDMTPELEDRYRKAYDEIVGRNIYSQDRRQYVYTRAGNGKYYSDCSSSQMAALQRIGLKTGGLLNTAGIHGSSKFKTVPVKIVDGHITNPEVLHVADQILYKGNDPKRPLQIGHVEGVYEMPGPEIETPKNSKAYAGTWPSLSNGRQGAQKKGFYQYGDGISSLKNYPTQIKRCQMVLNWLDDSTTDLTVDGKFGKKTKSKVNVCRKALGLSTTGVFDADLLERAKAFRK